MYSLLMRAKKYYKKTLFKYLQYDIPIYFKIFDCKNICYYFLDLHMRCVYNSQVNNDYRAQINIFVTTNRYLDHFF